MFNDIANRSLLSVNLTQLDLYGLSVVRGEYTATLCESYAGYLDVKIPRHTLTDDLKTQYLQLCYEWDDQKYIQHFLVTDVHETSFIPHDRVIRLFVASPLVGLESHHRARHFVESSLESTFNHLFDAYSELPIRPKIYLRENTLAQTFTAQHHESDWAFFQRLIRENGFNYYFESNPSELIVVIQDDPFKWPAISHDQKLHYQSSTDPLKSFEAVVSFEKQLKSVVNEVTVHHYDAEQPSQVHLKTAQNQQAVSSSYSTELHAVQLDTPERAQAHAQSQLQAFLSEEICFQLKSDCLGLRPGHQFDLISHPDSALNQAYTVVSITHSIDESFPALLNDTDDMQVRYYNRAKVIPSNIPFRPSATLKAARLGMSLGQITADSDAPKLDDNGKYWVRFAYDHTDEKPVSHPIRQVQPYAGRDCGMHFPLHDQSQVVMSYVDSDPNKPFILGALFNEEQPNVVNARNATENKIVTRSGHTFVMDDKENEQSIQLHTPDAKNRLRLDATVGDERIEWISELGYFDVNIAKHAQITTGESHALTVGESLSIQAENDIAINSQTESIRLNAAEDITLDAGQNAHIRVEESGTIEIKGDAEIHVEQHFRTNVLQGDYDIHVAQGAFQLQSKANVQCISKAGDVLLDNPLAKIHMLLSGELTLKGSKITLQAPEINLASAPLITHN